MRVKDRKEDQNSILIAGIATLILLTGTYILYLEREPGLQNAIDVAGVVSRVEPGVSRAKSTTFRYVEYEFDGEVFEIRDPTPNRWGYATGKNLTVSLDPEDPARAVLTGTVSYKILQVMPWILLPLAFLSFAVFMRAVVSYIRKR